MKKGKFFITTMCKNQGNANPKAEERDGYIDTIKGIEIGFHANRDDKNKVLGWTATELTTGFGVGTGKTRKAAAEFVDNNIDYLKAKLKDAGLDKYREVIKKANAKLDKLPVFTELPTKAEPPRPIGEQLRNSQPKVEARPEPKAEPVVVERPQPTASPFVQPRPQPQVQPQVQPQTQAPVRTSEPPVAPQRETSQSRREQPVPRQETKASFSERMRDFFSTPPTAETTTAPKTPKQTTPRTKGKPSEASMEDLRSRLAQSAEQNKPEPPKDDGKK